MTYTKAIVLFFLYLFCLSLAKGMSLKENQCQQNTRFNVGVGMYDITGPPAEVGMMGYGMAAQKTAGLLNRLWSRAFIIESPCNGKRIVFVNVDLGQVFQGIKQQVIQQLQKKYGKCYADDNVLITATHEHSGPGGYSTYAFYNLTIFGFSRENFNTIVNGIVASITRAENNMMSANIKIAKRELVNISFNRSPMAYLENPKYERDRYQDNTDKTMTLLRFDRLDGSTMGILNWFPLHGVSMNNKNRLINGDNKGYAAYLFEKDFGARYDEKSFVAGFAQANAGDVSHNPLGQEGGTDAKGLEAVHKAGYPQYAMAKQLFHEATENITGGVDYRHTFVEMDKVFIDPILTDGHIQTTCPAAIGVSMLAGTQDGEGIGKQGVTCETISQVIPHFICEKTTTTCQGVKPIALETGKMKPYPWTPDILPLQIIKIGHLIIVAAPFELTTMTGRRIVDQVAKVMPHHHIVLSALANAYAGYVATHEEYQIQRYEGASTHFGPWTSAALQQLYRKLANALAYHQAIEQGPLPPDLSNSQMTLLPGGRGPCSMA